MITLKKAVKALALMFAASLMMLSGIQARAAENNDTTITVLVDRLKVREAPSTNSKRIGTVTLGETHPCIDTVGDQWVAIEYHGKVAYVYGKYVSINCMDPVVESTPDLLETFSEEGAIIKAVVETSVIKENPSGDTIVESLEITPEPAAPTEETPHPTEETTEAAKSVAEAVEPEPAVEPEQAAEPIEQAAEPTESAAEPEPAIEPEPAAAPTEETPHPTEETTEAAKPVAEAAEPEPAVEPEPTEAAPEPTEPTEQPTPVEDSYEIKLLAALIQCEAVGESYVGQVAVGDVVMNRVADPRFPDSIVEVIYQPRQFSPIKTGKVERILANGDINESCLQAAREAYAGASVVDGCVSFRRAGRVNGMVIGHHVFF